MGLLDGGIKAIVGNAVTSIMLDFVLIKRTIVPAADPWNEPTETETEYTFKGFISSYKTHEIDDERILWSDRKLLIVGSSISVEPEIDDFVQLVGETRQYKIIAPIKKDPAQATITCNLR